VANLGYTVMFGDLNLNNNDVKLGGTYNGVTIGTGGISGTTKLGNVTLTASSAYTLTVSGNYTIGHSTHAQNTDTGTTNSTFILSNSGTATGGMLIGGSTTNPYIRWNNTDFRWEIYRSFTTPTWAEVRAASFKKSDGTEASYVGHNHSTETIKPVKIITTLSDIDAGTIETTTGAEGVQGLILYGHNPSADAYLRKVKIYDNCYVAQSLKIGDMTNAVSHNLYVDGTAYISEPLTMADYISLPATFTGAGQLQSTVTVKIANGSSAQALYVKELCVTDAWADGDTNKQTNGIFSRGNIKTKGSINADLDIKTISVTATNSYFLADAPAANESGIKFQSASVDQWKIYNPPSSTDLKFYSTADKVTITSAGNITTVGTITATSFLGITAANLPAHTHTSAATGGDYVWADITALGGTSQALGTASNGSGSAVALANHVHPTTGLMLTTHAANSITGFGASAAALGTSAAGTATTISRSDHVHAHGTTQLCTHNHDSSYYTKTEINTVRNEFLDNYIYIGLAVTPSLSSLTVDIAAGTAYVAGVRYAILLTNRILTASTTQYIYVNSSGAVVNSTTAPTGDYADLATVTVPASGVIPAGNITDTRDIITVDRGKWTYDIYNDTGSWAQTLISRGPGNGLFIKNKGSSSALTIHDLDTSLDMFTIDGSGNVKLKNGAGFYIYSDAETTQKLFVDGTTGNTTIAGSMTLSGSFNLKYGSYSRPLITAYGSDSNGLGAYIDSGAALIIGSGESASTICSNLPYSTEELWLTSDYVIRFMSNIQTGYAARKEMVYDSSGNLSLPGILTATGGVSGITAANLPAHTHTSAATGGDYAWADITGFGTSATALGTSVPGTATTVSRSDHVHVMPTLDALSNTTITSNSTGEILKWSGTAWINNTLSEAGIAPTIHGLINMTNHPVAGLTAGHVIRATAATTYAFGAIQSSDLPSSGVAASTYRSVTVDEKGRVTAGTNPTTLSGYGITDAAPLSHVSDTGASHSYIDQSVTTTGTPTFSRLTLNIASGTAPLTITSTTMCTNLNADMVDGLHIATGTNNVANQIVRTDANGYINAGWINIISGDRGTTTITRVYASDDAFLRYYSLANFSSQVFAQGNYKVNDSWLRENGDNATFKIYGNSRQMVFRTDGTTEYSTGVGASAFVWMYGGDAIGDKLMSLENDGEVKIKNKLSLVASDSSTQKFSIEFNETEDSLDFIYTA